MQIGEFRLVYPCFIENGPEKDTIFYMMDVAGLLDLRNSDKVLTHPIKDLPGSQVGWWHVSPDRLTLYKRWYHEKDRLLKIQLLYNNDYRIIYCEPREYKKYLTDEDLHWLRSLTESANWSVMQDEIRREQAETVEIKPELPKNQKPKKKRINKAKRRRKQRGFDYAD